MKLNDMLRYFRKIESSPRYMSNTALHRIGESITACTLHKVQTSCQFRTQYAHIPKQTECEALEKPTGYQCKQQVCCPASTTAHTPSINNHHQQKRLTCNTAIVVVEESVHTRATSEPFFSTFCRLKQLVKSRNCFQERDAQLGHHKQSYTYCIVEVYFR